jgi:hypothetical protein
MAVQVNMTITPSPQSRITTLIVGRLPPSKNGATRKKDKDHQDTQLLTKIGDPGPKLACGNRTEVGPAAEV